MTTNVLGDGLLTPNCNCSNGLTPLCLDICETMWDVAYLRLENTSSVALKSTLSLLGAILKWQLSFLGPSFCNVSSFEIMCMAEA